MKGLLLSTLLFPVELFAQAEKAAHQGLTADYMAKLLASLALVVGIILLLAWLVKRFNVMPQQQQGLIKILSTLSVSTRDRIALIQVGEEQLLIALTPGKISKLHHLTQPIEAPINTQGSFKKTISALLDDTQKAKNETKG